MPGPWTDLARPPLRQEALRRALVQGDPQTWRALDVVPTTASTNADVAERARAEEAEGYVLLADHQSAGRGRLNRQWTAPPRASLAISVLLRPGEPDADGNPPVPVERWSWLAMLAGLAVVEALTLTCGLPARLKWPNDVLVPDRPGAGGSDRGASGVPLPRHQAAAPRKVSGLLVEAAGGPGTRSAVVVGAGINVSQNAAELPVDTATSLALAGAATTDRDTVARAYLRALSRRYGRWRTAAGDPTASGVVAAYREACATIGSAVRVLLPGGGVLDGVAEGVDDVARLLVRDADGVVRPLAAGDVVHLRPPT